MADAPKNPEMKMALPGLPPKQLVREHNCGNCKFSSLRPGDMNQRECHRYPPTTAHIMVQTARGQAGWNTYSSPPIVKPQNWCGEWAPHIERLN